MRVGVKCIYPFEINETTAQVLRTITPNCLLEVSCQEGLAT